MLTHFFTAGKIDFRCFGFGSISGSVLVLQGLIWVVPNFKRIYKILFRLEMNDKRANMDEDLSTLKYESAGVMPFPLVRIAIE